MSGLGTKQKSSNQFMYHIIVFLREFFSQYEKTKFGNNIALNCFKRQEEISVPPGYEDKKREQYFLQISNISESNQVTVKSVGRNLLEDHDSKD